VAQESIGEPVAMSQQRLAPHHRSLRAGKRF
jgi:hypothetical protein